MNSWQVQSLGNVCLIIGGGTPSKQNDDFYGGEIPWATVRDMKHDVITKTEHKITQEAIKSSATNIIDKENVVIATRVGLGKVCFLAQDTAINQDLRGIIPKNPNKIDTRFLFWWLKSISSLIEKAGTGMTVKGVKLPFIKSLEIPVPSIAEQKRIVAILDEAFEGIDGAIANTEKNLANARELFESYLNAIFTHKGDDWEDKKLGDICENLDSKRVPITKSKRTSGEIPYYGASGVVDYVAEYIFDEDLLLVSEDGANLLARTYPIAFSISGKAWINNHAHVLRFEDMSLQKFIEYYLNSISLEPYVSGMAQPKLNQRSLNSIPVPFAPKADLEQIVENIDSLFSETKRLEAIYQQKLAALHELKQSILQKAFSGELTAEAGDRAVEGAKAVVAA